jgi:hypothetical protein
VITRLVVVVVLLAGVAVACRGYRSRRARLADDPPVGTRVPAELRKGADRTWVVFTTPYCAGCGPVEERLRSSDPGARVVRVDATRDPLLAEAFAVRSAPTAVLADADGRVQARLVGAEAVHRWAGDRA